MSVAKLRDARQMPAMRSPSIVPAQVSRRAVLGSAASLAALGASPALAQAGASGDAEATRVLDGIAEALLRDAPESASSLGIDTGARAPLKSRLADRSPAGQARVQANLRQHLAALDRLDPATLSPAVRVHVDVARSAFDTALAGLALPYGDVAVGGWRNSPFVVVQNVGSYLDTPRFLDSDHAIATPADAEAYLARLQAWAGVLDGETDRLRAATARGVVPPSFLLDKALGQIAASQAGPVTQWDAYTSFHKRAGALAGVRPARAAAILEQAVRPALARQQAELERQRARAKDAAGVWALPEGDRYYAWALRASTTTTMTPDEVHRLGLEELAELQGRMDPILRGLGYTRGSVGARMTALGKDPRFLFPEDDAGRAQVIALLEQRIADMHGRMPRAFRTLVPGRVAVQRLPLAEEPGAPGAYGGAGSIDGSVPGKLWINLRSTALWPRYSLPTLAYHEAIPGHAWQGEYTFRLPLIRSLLSFNAYSEGWALYAEQLGDELGAYADDPVGQLGYLQSLAFRACRLVVDTGLHHKRWSREQAVRWFSETNGSSVEEVAGEVDRYCSWPGQACGYKIGHSEINRLRHRAKDALGTRYDFRSFNDAVVTGGGVPMTVLARLVDAHIAQRRG